MAATQWVVFTSGESLLSYQQLEFRNTNSVIRTSCWNRLNFREIVFIWNRRIPSQILAMTKRVLVSASEFRRKVWISNSSAVFFRCFSSFEFIGSRSLEPVHWSSFIEARSFIMNRLPWITFYGSFGSLWIVRDHSESLWITLDRSEPLWIIRDHPGSFAKLSRIVLRNLKTKFCPTSWARRVKPRRYSPLIVAENRLNAFK